jgi:hypothetical protein
MLLSLVGFAERQHAAWAPPARPAPRHPRRPRSVRAATDLPPHRPRPHPAPCRTHTSVRRQPPVTADSPEGISFSRMSSGVARWRNRGISCQVDRGRAAPALTRPSPLVLLRSWRTAVTCDTCPSAHAYGRGCRVHAVGGSLPLSQWAGTGQLIPENWTQATPAPSAARSVYVGPAGTP